MALYRLKFAPIAPWLSRRASALLCSLLAIGLSQCVESPLQAAAPGAIYQDANGNLNTTAGPTGALGSIVTSDQFHMVADGSTDNTTAFQAGINAAAVGSGVFFIRSGAITEGALLTSGSTSFTVASTTGLYVGEAVSGLGIPFGTTISSISGTTITLSGAVTASGPINVTFIGAYNFSGTVICPPAVTIRGACSPGDTNGYVPWKNRAPFKVHLHFTGTTATALYIPYYATNRLQDFELSGTSSATGTGICAGVMFDVAGSTNSNTSLTNITGPFVMTPKVGMIVDGGDWNGGDLPTPVTLTVTLTSGSPTFTVGSTTGLASGMVVRDQDQTTTGIPTGTTMTLSGSTVTLSKNATQSGSQQVTFYNAITAYNAGAQTITMSNAATGTHSTDVGGTNGFIQLIDSNYPGTNLFEFGGALLEATDLYVHDFGVPFAAGYGDGMLLSGCYFGNGQFADLLIDGALNCEVTKCYIGGDNIPTYPAAVGYYQINATQGNLVKDTQINNVGTGIFTASGAVLMGINLAFEGVGTSGNPQVDLRTNSYFWANAINNNIVPTGAIPIRVTGGSSLSLRTPIGAAGTSASGTLSSNTTISSMSSGDTAKIFAGEIVSDGGVNIPDLTYVVSKTSTSVTLSQAATGSATESINFTPPSIEATDERYIDVPDPSLTNSLRRNAIINGSNVVTSIIPAGSSITLLTHGVVAPHVTIPAGQVDGSSTQLLENPSLGSPQIADATSTGTGLSIAGGAVHIWHTGSTQWDFEPTGIYANATNNAHGQFLGGFDGSANQIYFTFNDAASAGIGHRAGGVSLVANNLDAFWAVASGSTVDLQVNRTMTASGTNGAQTINKSAGSVNFAAAASSVVVTNSLVSATSIVIATVQGNDATMKSVTISKGSGSFTINANAAATGATEVDWIVLNGP